MAEHFRLVFNIIYSYIICIQKHMYNLNLYICSISHPLWTDDISFFWLRNVMFCESPKKVGFNVARMKHVVKSGWSGQRDDARATAECPAGHDTRRGFLQVVGVFPSSLDGLYWFIRLWINTYRYSLLGE